ncbi:MAG: peptidoglycan-binding domain-containing protein [Pseudomonadota bacterium]
MSDLQNGAKGHEVKTLQKAMNAHPTLGARLKEDGVFGEKTEAAFKKWQKLQGQKPTGKASKGTVKAIQQSSAKAPVMTVRDYAPRIKNNTETLRENGAELANQAAQLDEARKALRKRIDDSHAIEKKMAKANAQNQAYFADWLNDAEKIADLQQRFETMASRDPAGAAKLLKDIQALDAQAEKAFVKIRSNIQTLNAEWRKLQPIFDAAA